MVSFQSHVFAIWIWIYRYTFCRVLQQRLEAHVGHAERLGGILQNFVDRLTKPSQTLLACDCGWTRTPKPSNCTRELTRRESKTVSRAPAFRRCNFTVLYAILRSAEVQAAGRKIAGQPLSARKEAASRASPATFL